MQVTNKIVTYDIENIYESRPKVDVIGNSSNQEAKNSTHWGIFEPVSLYSKADNLRMFKIIS